MTETSSDPRLIMQAALDGELDAAGQMAFERSLADDLMLAKEYERLTTLRLALRTKIAPQPAPAALRARLNATSSPASANSNTPSFRRAAALAAAIVVGVAIGSSGTYLGLRENAPNVVDALVAGHRRALLAETPVDLASNDRHNVRPWFDARIALSPPAPDLTARGFPLVGGRIDIINGTPAPTLVYRLREHLVSVTALPVARTAKAGAAIGGYRMVAWGGADFAFYAVSDADLPELENFAEAFRAEETGGAEPRR
jgi:anti-sigma factor RsiW